MNNASACVSRLLRTIGPIAGLVAILGPLPSVVADVAHADATKALIAQSGVLAERFHPPAPIVDQHGRTLLTRRAVGHPAVADLNGDGLNDILLGCHTSMDAVDAEILVLQNVGAPTKPRFQWPARSLALRNDAPLSFSCGCKSGGTFEIHPVDYNGDGRCDLVVDTFWTRGVMVMLNTGTPDALPTFTPGPTLHTIGSHGIGSGGGDWDGDGLADYVHRVNGHGWQVHTAQRSDVGAVTFSDKPTMTSDEYTMIDHDAYAKVRGRPRWFDHSPYAWNYSGRGDGKAGIVEIVAVMEAPGNKARPYTDHRCHINIYRLDRRARTCTYMGRLATSQAAHTRLGIGDLNGDGSMDVLYTGGVFTQGDETAIWVLYGKTRNVPAD